MSDTQWTTIHRQQHHFGWDNQQAPVRTIAPGERVELEIVDASGGQLDAGSTAEQIAALDFARVNPVTGPLYIDGAEPGDAIAVDILEFDVGRWGWTGIIPGFGLLAEEFADPFLHISHYDAERVEFTPEIHLPTRPFPGTIGVAPSAPGRHSVVPPRHVGGNMDFRDLTAGARLYLPVEVPGALLSVGDTHAAQGDGEVCGTAVETAMTVRLQVELIKDRDAGIRRPQFDVPAPPPASASKGHHVTTGVGPDLMAAARDAIRDMIDHIVKTYGLDASLAYCLCSVAVDLRITEIVDVPNWMVAAYLPRAIFR